MKFKSDIEVQAGLKDSSGAAGTSGQVLSSDGTAVSWIDGEIGVARDVQNRVKAGVAINKGQAVYVTGADGTNIIVGLASNTAEATSSKTLGLLNATVATNGFADVVQIGKLTGLNTIGAIVGDPVWLGTNGNLIYGLANKPYAPAHLVYIGVVTRVNASNGEIFVTVQNGFELNEIHDVDLKTNIPISGDVLGYNGSLWVNKTIPGWLGYTPADDANVVKLTGNQTINGEKTFAGTIYSDNATYLKQYTSFSNQTDYTNIGGQPEGIYIGTTSAASTISMTNLTAFRFYELPDASGTIALTSDIHNPVTIGTGNGLYLTTIAGVPTQQLNLFLSTATQNGALSSTDWTTFNNKQNQLNGTGFVKASGTTISYDNTSYLPLSGGTMTGQIILKESSGSTDYTKGLRFPNDPFGGVSDVAGIRLYASSGENQVFEFYIGNDTLGDKINFATGVNATPNNDNVTINGNIVWNAGNIANPISGTGTANFLPKFSGTSVLENSVLQELYGVIGLGVTPKNWDNDYKILQISSAAITGAEDATSISHNLFIEGAVSKYISNRAATSYAQNIGNHYWYTAPSGIANASFTASLRMILTNAGRLGLGTPDPQTNLHIKHSGAYAGIRVDNTGTTGGGFFAAYQNGNQIGLLAVSGAVIGDTSSNLALFSETGKMIDLMTNGSVTPKMRITLGGNILVNTTSDNGSRLQVAGNTYSEGLHIATGQFTQSGGTTSTFYTFSNVASNRVFMITIRQSGGVANNMAGMAFTFGANGGAYNIAQDNTNPVLFLTISTSGLALRLTTGAGYGSTTWDYTITQIK